MERYQRNIFNQWFKWFKSNTKTTKQIDKLEYYIVEPFIEYVCEQFPLSDSIGFNYDVAHTWETFLYSKQGQEVLEELYDSLPNKEIDQSWLYEFIDTVAIAESLPISYTFEEWCAKHKIGKRMIPKIWEFLKYETPWEYATIVEAVHEDEYSFRMWEDKKVGNSLYLDVHLSEKELFEEYGGNVIVLLSIDIKAIIADIKAKQVA